MRTEFTAADGSTAPPFHPRATPREASLVWDWARRDFHVRYRRSALRAAWAVLQPFFFVVVFTFIFGVIFRSSGGDLPFLTYLLAGMVVLRVVAAGISANACLSESFGIITHSRFRKEVIPLARVLGTVPDLLVTTIGLLLVARIQGMALQPTVVLVPVVLASVMVLTAALCIAFSTIQVFVRDVQFASVLVVQALFFASPISYRPEQLPSSMRWLNSVNPISVDIEALRDVAVRGRWPDWWLFGIHALAACGMLVGAIAHLRSVEHRIVDLA